MLIRAAAKQWHLDYGAIDGLLTNWHPDFLPPICGVSDPPQPPDVEAATAQAQAVAMESETLAVVGSLHDDPIADHPPAAKGAVAIEPVSTPPASGKQWQTIMKLAEDHCARNPFPGVNALATILKCSPSTIRKAIEHSQKLRRYRDKFEQERKPGNHKAMTAAHAASAKQSRECNPAEAVSTDEIFRALLEQAKEHERAALHALSDSQRRELVAAMDEDTIRKLFERRAR